VARSSRRDAEELYFTPPHAGLRSCRAANLLPGRVENGLVRTALGSFPANGSNGASEVEVLVRPELLELAPDPAGPAEVVAREFSGHDVFYRVLFDGVELMSQRHSNEVVPLGARVSIRVHDGRAPILG
jgi:iron(III) transport system ATP-binding protein